MATRIVVTVGQLRAEAELDSSPCAEAILKALPITARANTWGDEIYFATSVDFPAADDAREEMEVGEVAYWPPGKAVCIFFGPTPASERGGRPVAASPVNPVGRIVGETAPLRQARDGEKIVLARAE